MEAYKELVLISVFAISYISICVTIGLVMLKFLLFLLK